jgi:zinc transporter ZupT
MHSWRGVIGSAAVAAACVAVLTDVRDAVVAVAAGAMLVIALAILARSALRLAGDPAPRDVEPPPPRS